MTSAARTAASPSPSATRTRAPARASPAERAGARSRGRARTCASALLGAWAGLAAATALVALAPAVGRGAADDIGRTQPRRDNDGQPREPAMPPVASVLAPAMAVGTMPRLDSAEARP